MAAAQASSMSGCRGPLSATRGSALATRQRSLQVARPAMHSVRFSSFTHKKGGDAQASHSRSKICHGCSSHHGQVTTGYPSRLRPLCAAKEPWEIAPPGPNESKEVFAEVQRSMLLVNDSRLKALEELKVARRRIQELEAELGQTKAELTKAQAAAQAPAPTAAPSAPPGHQQPQYDAPQHVQEPQEEARSSPKTITILYSTGWREVFVHCNVDNCGWTKAPGMRMSQAGNNQWKAELPGTRAEFVVNNGGNDWDKPDPYKENGPKNYTISSPGTYRLQSGKIQVIDRQ